MKFLWEKGMKFFQSNQKLRIQIKLIAKNNLFLKYKEDLTNMNQKAVLISGYFFQNGEISSNQVTLVVRGRKRGINFDSKNIVL
jgi:hypothetical protein